MKHTLEEAAKEHQNGSPTCEGDSICAGFINGRRHQCYKSFIAGVKWQSKQSPWISVKDKLSELGDPVLIRLKDGTVRLAVLDTDDNSDAYFWSDNYSYETISGWDTTHWMPIPPLESNDNE